MKHIQIIGNNPAIGISPFMVGCVFAVERETEDFYIIEKTTFRYPDAIKKCSECVVLPKNISECEPYIKLLLLRTNLTYDIFYANANEDAESKLLSLESFIETLNEQSNEQRR